MFEKYTLVLIFKAKRKSGCYGYVPLILEKKQTNLQHKMPPERCGLMTADLFAFNHLNSIWEKSTRRNIKIQTGIAI